MTCLRNASQSLNTSGRRSVSLLFRSASLAMDPPNWGVMLDRTTRLAQTTSVPILRRRRRRLPSVAVLSLLALDMTALTAATRAQARARGHDAGARRLEAEKALRQGR